MILGITVLGLAVIGRWDRPLAVGWQGRIWILAGTAAELICVAEITVRRSLWEKVLWGSLGGCLLLACITDSLICQVYNFTWWIALAAALPLGCVRKGPWEGIDVWLESLTWVLLFAGIQLLLGGRIFGRADGYAFCVCAVAEAAVGMSVTGFLAHMLSAYVLLFAVQAVRRNINKWGNLKVPAPFLPYITAAFWLNLLLFHYFRAG